MALHPISEEDLEPTLTRAAARPFSFTHTAWTGESAGTQISKLFQQYAPLGYMLPWETLDYVELLSTYNPDYSQAVDNIRTLANSGHELFVGASAPRTAARIKDRLEEKARTIQSQHGGIDGLIDKLLDQAAVYGAMCGEWVLNEQLNDVVDFIDINPKSIRFFWSEPDQRYVPFQKVSIWQAQQAEKQGQEVKQRTYVRLNELTFHYYAFDAAPQSPYGCPPFLAALANIAIQRDMIYNMAQIVKKVGLLGIIDLVVKSLPVKAGETEADYQARASMYLDQYATVLEEAVRDGGLVHYDDTEMHNTNITGNAAGATNIFKQNEELIFSGLKSMPSVQGRSYCVQMDALVLTAGLEWVPAGQLCVGDELVGFDEDLGRGAGKGNSARLRSSVVQVAGRVTLPSVRIKTTGGTEIVVSKQHPIVAINCTGQRVWKEAGALEVGDRLAWFGNPWLQDEIDPRDAGYLAGIFDGEGTMTTVVDAVRHTSALRMSQLPGPVLDETVLALKRAGFECSVIMKPAYKNSQEIAVLSVLGGRYCIMRFLGLVQPHRFMPRSKRVWENAMLKRNVATNDTVRIRPHVCVDEIEDVGERELVALQTSTRTFIAEGLLHHNSTTETYAGVAYDIIIRNTQKYQRACKRMLESGYWLMTTLWGEQPDSISLTFNDNKTLNRLQNAQAQKQEIQNAVALWLTGIIDQLGFAQLLGYNQPKTEMATPPKVPLLGTQSSGGSSSGGGGSPDGGAPAGVPPPAPGTSN